MKKTERRTSRISDQGSPAKTVKPSGRRQAGSVVVEEQVGEHLDLTEIKELIELISEKQFNEFELERGGFRLRLRRGASPMAEASPAIQAPVPATVVSSVVAETAVSAKPAEEDLHIITSPIVGTFYRSPSPTSDSFVKIGDTVEVGRTLCIIEAMKLMNEIQSDAVGVVAKMFVENGQPVEYGQPLFGLKR